MFTFLDHCH